MYYLIYLVTNFGVTAAEKKAPRIESIFEKVLS